MMRSPLVFLCLLLALASCPSARADKTDVVVFKNGDKITGEVKGMQRGKLQFSTDTMGTVFIEWEDIQAVISETGQAVELTNGQRFYGPLRKSESSEMVQIETGQGAVGVATMDVINMYPVEASFWDRLDLSASLGFSWDKGSEVGKYSVGLDGDYRDPNFITQVGLSAEVTTQAGGDDDTSRANAYATHLIFNRSKRFLAIFGNLDRNDQLGIDMRSLLGVGYGWVPLRSNNHWFMMSGGLDVNHEIPHTGESETNLEAVGMLSYDYFKYSAPERSFSSSLRIFPGLTDAGRWRADFNADFKLEFIRDFFWKMSLYANYDSDPISVEGEKSDYGVTSSLAYEF